MPHINRSDDLRTGFFIFILIYLSSLSFNIFSLDDSNAALFENTKLSHIPVAYKGRFRPLDVYSRLWLYDFYHGQNIKKTQLSAFHIPDGSSQELVWRLHFLGHKHWDDAPFFWIHLADLKKLLNLDPKTDTFSYNQLRQKIYLEKDSSASFLSHLAIYTFLKNFKDPSNRSGSEKQELAQLNPGLWIAFHNNDIVVMASSLTPPWNNLQKGMILLKDARQRIDSIINQDRAQAEEAIALMASMSDYEKTGDASLKQNQALANSLRELQKNSLSPQDIGLTLEMQMPLSARLQQSGTTIKALPSIYKNGEWYSLHALKSQVYDPALQKIVPVGNFTPYSDELFNAIRNTYAELEKSIQTTFSGSASVSIDERQEARIGQLADKLSELLIEGYATLAGTSYKQATGKGLSYPSIGQLRMESSYYRYPLTEASIALYALALLTFLLAITTNKTALNKWALCLMLLGFCVHTVVLLMRCYILGRPPVSNMFETVIYVPWIAVLASFILYYAFKNPLVLIGSCTASLVLLIVLKLTNVNSSMENVQAVLDSQYWLIIHVLMVVGSYGLFILSGILGHIYLICSIVKKHETPSMQFIAKFTLQAMYMGIAMLIPGTILGGVWAAESWGRFWDWDPKESWAFISCCVYLIWVHAFRFHHIRNFGLAVGSVVGLLAISFTWYGVNYILGTGLHSYGFGSGGELYYYLFLICEIAFLGIVGVLHNRNVKIGSQ